MIKIGVKTNIAFVSHRLIPMLLGAVFLFFFASCGMGLDPAWKSESGLHINFGNPNSALDSRALAGGNGASGHLSIRTESKAGTQVWGPWKITPPQAFSTSEIPAGTYSSIILVYGTSPVDTAWLADQKSSTLEASLAVEYPGQVSWAEKTSFVIKEGAVTQLSATLIPAVPEVLTIDLEKQNDSTTLNFSNVNTFSFVKVTNLNVGLEEGSSVESVTITTTSSTVSLVFYDVLGKKMLPITPTSAEGSSSWTLQNPDDTFYLACAWDGTVGEVTLNLDRKRIETDPEPEVFASVRLTGATSLEGKKVLVAIETEPEDPENSEVVAGGVGQIGSDGSVGISLFSTLSVDTLWKPEASVSYSVVMFIDENSKWSTEIDITALELMPNTDIAGSRFWNEPVTATTEGEFTVVVQFSTTIVLSSYLLYPEIDAETAYLQVGYLNKGKKVLLPPWNVQTNAPYEKPGYTFKGWATSIETATIGTIDYAVNDESLCIYTGAPGINIELWPVWEEKPVEITFTVSTTTPEILDISGDAILSMASPVTLTGPEGFVSYLWTLNGMQVGTSQNLADFSLESFEILNLGTNEFVLVATDASGTHFVGTHQFTLIP